jgi:hypothetical protein
MRSGRFDGSPRNYFFPRVIQGTPDHFLLCFCSIVWMGQKPRLIRRIELQCAISYDAIHQ